MAGQDELVGTLADEEAAMRSGRGRILIGWGVFGVGSISSSMPRHSFFTCAA